jgi:transcriptional regulator with XRE-family HTH domain
MTLPGSTRRFNYVQLPYLKAWRLYRLLSQAELARRARVTPETVSNAERGRRVTFVTIGRLARALKVERAALLSSPPQETQS